MKLWEKMKAKEENWPLVLSQQVEALEGQSRVHEEQKEVEERDEKEEEREREGQEEEPQ